MDNNRSSLNSPKFRSKIPELRRKKGITQKDLADLLGITINTIANWETGRVCPYSFIIVAILCQKLECSACDLIEFNDLSLNAKNLNLAEMRKCLGTEDK